MNQKQSKALAVCLLTASLLFALPGASAGHDDDDIPDEAEGVLCGSAALRQIIGMTGVAQCASDDDLTVGDAPELPEGADEVMCGDADGDGLVGAGAPGSCSYGPDGPTYTPPPVEGLDEIMCGDAADEGLVGAGAPGSCSYGPDGPTYTPPPLPETPDGVNELMCGEADGQGLVGEGAPGSCEYGADGPTYTPPAPPGVPAACSQSSDPFAIILGLISDADCDGWANENELQQGCDMLNAGSHPDDPDSCTGAVPPPPGFDSPNACVDEPASPQANPGDLDCDGDSNERELCQGTNPIVTHGREFPAPWPVPPQAPLC